MWDETQKAKSVHSTNKITLLRYFLQLNFNGSIDLHRRTKCMRHRRATQRLSSRRLHYSNSVHRMSIGFPVMVLIDFQFSSNWCVNSDWWAGSSSGADPWKIPSSSGLIVLTDQKFVCSTRPMLPKWSIKDYYLSSRSKPIYKVSEVISIETNTFSSGCCRRSKVRAVAIVSTHSSITKKCSYCC